MKRTLATSRSLRVLYALFALVFVCAASSSVAAAPRKRCFAETNHCISGALLAYWENNGGLPVFGYPISDVRNESVEETWYGPTQWFERDRLEDHGTAGVMAGRLGARALEQQGHPWTQGTGPVRGDGNCIHFPQTGYNVCGKFSTFWRQNGTEIRIGYPITDVINETIEGKVYQVQYFERRRLEYHLEYPGANADILLGLLGRETLAGDTSNALAIGQLTIDPTRVADPINDPVTHNVYGYETVTLTVSNLHNAARVVFFADPQGMLGRDIGSTTKISDGRATLRWTVPPVTGTYTLYAQASDNTGQFVTSQAVPLVVLLADQVPTTN